MEFFQESTFTAFLALILAFVVAKIVSFAVSCSVNEGAVEKEVILDRGLGVKREKDKKRVTFVDDVVINKVDLYQGFVVKSVGEVIVEEKSVDEKAGKRVDQFAADPKDKGSEIVEMLIEEKCDDDKIDRFLGQKEETLVTSGLKSDDMIIDQKEGTGVEGIGENEEIITEDDDWEGIERSELEKVFAEAVNYLEYGGKKGKEKSYDQLAKLGNDVHMQLYALHKVAVEGPCHEPQPMALKVSARAKWNAWQRLGSMSQEVAMEQYIRVLSDNIPGWMHNYSADDDIQGSHELETVDKISVPEYERC